MPIFKALIFSNIYSKFFPTDTFGPLNFLYRIYFHRPGSPGPSNTLLFGYILSLNGITRLFKILLNPRNFINRLR